MLTIGLMTICQPLWAATCSDVFRGAFGSSLLKKKVRYIGYRGKMWSPEKFRTIINEEGLYSPLVHTVAVRERISLGQAHERLKYLTRAPEEVQMLLLSRHVGYWNTNTPFVSSSYRKGVAKRYANKKTHEENSLYNPLESINSVRFTVSVDKTYNPLLLEFRYSRGMKLIFEAHDRFLRLGENSLKEGDDQIKHLEKQLKIKGLSKKEIVRFSRELENEKRLILLIKWLIEHDWLKILFDGRSETEGVLYFSKLTEDLLDNQALLLAISKSYYILRDGDSEILLHIPAEKITKAQLF